jgi:hypothetical protein
MHPRLRPQGQRASKADCLLPGHSKRPLLFAARRESAHQADDRSFRPPQARIGEFYSNPRTRTFAELLIDAEEERTVRALLVGMLKESEPRP